MQSQKSTEKGWFFSQIRRFSVTGYCIAYEGIPYDASLQKTLPSFTINGHPFPVLQAKKDARFLDIFS